MFSKFEVLVCSSQVNTSTPGFSCPGVPILPTVCIFINIFLFAQVCFVNIVQIQIIGYNKLKRLELELIFPFLFLAVALWSMGEICCSQHCYSWDVCSIRAISCQSSKFKHINHLPKSTYRSWLMKPPNGSYWT